MKKAGYTIKSLLEQRNAGLKGVSGDCDVARRREKLTLLIQKNYCKFEKLRDKLLRNEPMPMPNKPFAEELFAALIEHDMLRHDKAGYQVKKAEVKRYLSGGWLEELTWLAAEAAGADEALFGQSVHWHAAGYRGENEIDLLVRRHDRLGFASCKALKSSFTSDDRKHRNRLMEALHEADNLADHFGVPGERVAVVVTTDLIDEMKGQPRYMALMGKAAVLDVRIIPLEELGWDELVAAINGLIAE